MSEKISCRNVIKIKFDSKPKDATANVVEEGTPTPPPGAAALMPKLPPLHPSVSEENLRWRFIETSDTVIHAGAPVAPNSPLRSSSSRPPRAKQLQSVKLLIDQHNKHISCSECQFMFLIDAAWLNAWYRCVISNDTSLYPGPINNWDLVATAQDSSLANGTSSTSSLTLPVITPAVTAIFNRASALRGLSFDGVECDFAEELEQYQEKLSKSPLKDALASTTANNNGAGDKQASAVDYDYQTCQFAIKRELREDVDFYLLPLEAWQALHGWYGGGPPLPRSLTHSLQYRASVPCAVGELLLQHPPVHHGAPEDQEDGQNVRCDGFAEGAAMHDQDLHPPTDLLPCMQDTLRPIPQTPTGFSLLHSGGGGLHRSFSSINSLNHSLSTMSFPSMNDLQSISDVASVSALNIAAPIVAHNDGSSKVDTVTAGTSADEAKSDTADINSSTDTSNNTSAKNTTNDDSAGPSSTVSGKIVAKSSAFCHVCQRRAVTRCSKCGSIYYCGRDCQLLHWRFHKTLCPKLSKRRQLLEEASKATANASAAVEADTPAPSPSSAVIAVPVVHDRAGKVGLANLGNSCYMNSSLQCLSHIKPLTLAFLSHRVFKDLNSSSRDGSGGKLAEQYGKLLEELWFEYSRRSVSPHQLKATLGRINSEYAGLAQQDAHELIELLLDKLHEDLNRVLKKPYTEKVEWDGISSERAVAEASWFTHGLRENSVVRDLMGSLMRYQLTCPDCGKVSLSFEYHTTLQVAIPRRNTITKRVIFIPQLLKLTDLDPLLKKSPNTTTLQALLQYTVPESYEIVVDRLSTVRTLREAILKKIPPVHLQGSDGDVLLVESAFPVYAAVTRMLRDNQPVGKLAEEAVIYAYCPPTACPHHVFLFQRVFDPILELEAGTPDGSPTNTTSTTPAPAVLEWKSLLRTNLVGLPILLSYDSKWTCTRLRYQVLMNTVRLFKSDSVFLRDAERVFANGARGLLEQFAMSDSLDLRLVDSQGTSSQTQCAGPGVTSAPTVVPGHTSLAGQLKDIWQGAAAVNAVPTPGLQQEWTTACAALDGAQQQNSNNVELLFGSQLYTDRAIKIEDFGGVVSFQSPEQNGVMFLSLDLLGSMRTGFDDAAIRKLYPAGATTSTTTAGETTAAASPGTSKGGFTLYQCLQEHTKEEVLDAGNEVYCSACKEHKAARKVVRFCRAHLPQVLVLSLKRFEFRDVSGLTGFQGSAHREKIDTFIDFPIDGLDLTPFCQPDDQPSVVATSAGTGTPASAGNSSPIYDLFAVCNHYGRMGFGHYTAAARDWEGAGLSSKWFAYDDNDVTGPCTPEEEEAEVHSRNAYILFYRQRGSPSTVE